MNTMQREFPLNRLRASPCQAVQASVFKPLFAAAFVVMAVAGFSQLSAAPPTMNKGADPTEISIGPKPSTQYVLRTNEVAVIETVTKGWLRLQFTSTTRTTANYRWRHRTPGANAIQEGTGSLCWAKDSIKQPDGTFREVARPEHNSKIIAGDLKIGWYPGHISIYPTKATIQILKEAKEFERPF